MRMSLFSGHHSPLLGFLHISAFTSQWCSLHTHPAISSGDVTLSLDSGIDEEVSYTSTILDYGLPVSFHLSGIHQEFLYQEAKEEKVHYDSQRPPLNNDRMVVEC
jgi:hypothetical protein